MPATATRMGQPTLYHEDHTVSAKEIAHQAVDFGSAIGKYLLHNALDIYEKDELVQLMDSIQRDTDQACDYEEMNQYFEAVTYYLSAATQISSVIGKFAVKEANRADIPFSAFIKEQRNILKKVGNPKLISAEKLEKHFDETTTTGRNVYHACVVLLEQRKHLLGRAKMVEYHLDNSVLSRCFFYDLFPLNAGELQKVHCAKCNRKRSGKATKYLNNPKTCKNPKCKSTHIRIGQKYALTPQEGKGAEVDFDYLNKEAVTFRGVKIFQYTNTEKAQNQRQERIKEAVDSKKGDNFAYDNTFMNRNFEDVIKFQGLKTVNVERRRY